MKSELITLASLLLLVFSPKIAYAELLTFECVFTEYSDERGKHNYSKAHTFKIFWDKAINKASQQTKYTSVNLRVADGQDMVSFIDTASNGDVVVTSIYKIKAMAVQSRNLFAFPSQAYGQCTID
jgi:hypothetical protein